MVDFEPDKPLTNHEPPIIPLLEQRSKRVVDQAGPGIDLTSATLPPVENLSTRTLISAILSDLAEVGITKLTLAKEAVRGCSAEAVRWIGAYSLTVLALEAAIEHSPTTIPYLAAFALCFLIADHLDTVWTTNVDIHDRSYHRRLKERLLDTIGRSNLADLTDEDRRSQLELQYDRTSQLSNIIESSASTPSYITKLALSAGALALADWKIGAMAALAVLPGFYLKSKQTRQDLNLEDRQAASHQIAERIETEAYSTEGATRMILGGLTKQIKQTLTHLQVALDSEKASHERRQSSQLFLANLGYYGAMFGGLTMLFGQYQAGVIEVGTFAFLCLQLRDLGEELSSHGDTFQGFRKIWEQAHRFYSFVNRAPVYGIYNFPDSHEIKLKDAVFSRGDFSVTVKDLTIPPGSFVVVHGGSGAGKTTLLQRLAFATEPSSGTVLVGDVPLNKVRFSEWQSQIAYCGARAALLEGRTIREILLGGDEDSRNLEERCNHPLIAALVKDLEKLHGLDTRIGEGLPKGRGLSTGEQPRLILTAALIPRPKIIFLDEVTSNQSEDFVTEVRDLLKEYCSLGSTVIFATHSKKFDSSASHIVKISGGSAELQVPTTKDGAGSNVDLIA